MWNLERVQMNLFAKQKQRHRQNKCMSAESGLGWDKPGACGWHMTPLCIKQATTENLLDSAHARTHINNESLLHSTKQTSKMGMRLVSPSPWAGLPQTLLLAHFFTLLYGELSDTQSVSSVTQACLTLCDPMDCSTPGLPVHHQLPEFTQTHIHWVSHTIQPSHPLPSPSPAVNFSQHQGLF